MIDEKVMIVQKALNTPIPPVKDIHLALENDILMIMPYLNADGMDKYTKGIFKHSEATRWHEYSCDVLPLDSGKILGIQKVLDYYNLDWNEIMTIGDNENDIEMIQQAGIGIAMGNAKVCVKNAADYVTDDVDDDGVVSALYHFGLLE